MPDATAESRSPASRSRRDWVMLAGSSYVPGAAGSLRSRVGSVSGPLRRLSKAVSAACSALGLDVAAIGASAITDGDVGPAIRSGPSGPRPGVRVGRPGSWASGIRTVAGGIAQGRETGRRVRLSAPTGGAGTRPNSAVAATNAGAGMPGRPGSPGTRGAANAGCSGVALRGAGSAGPPREGNDGDAVDAGDDVGGPTASAASIDRPATSTSDSSSLISLVSSTVSSAYHAGSSISATDSASTDDSSRRPEKSNDLPAQLGATSAST